MRKFGYFQLLRSYFKSLVRNLGYELVPVQYFRSLTLDLRAVDYLENLIFECGQNFDFICVVGCNNGDTIEQYLNRFSPKKIIGFEPNPKLFESCQERFANRSIVSIENYALGHDNGTMRFNIYDDDATSSVFTVQNLHLFNRPIVLKETIEVQMLRFQDYYREEIGPELVNLLHIDTQGFDLHVLFGAERVLLNWLAERGFIFLGFVENQKKKIVEVPCLIWADAIFINKNIETNDI